MLLYFTSHINSCLTEDAYSVTTHDLMGWYEEVLGRFHITRFTSVLLLASVGNA